MTVTSHRVSNAKGYLEVISSLEDGRMLAYITDIYGSVKTPLYVGFYGIHEVTGSTVADVKSELFKLIDEGQ